MRISQREAHRLRKRVEQLEDAEKRRRDRWSSDWGVGWTSLTHFSVDPEVFATIKTARLLRHAVICLPDGNGAIRIYAETL